MLDSLVQFIAEARSSVFWAWAGPLVLSVPAALYLGAARLRQSRAIRDTPTATIRAAHQGYVELQGVGAVADIDIASPLTGTPCVWWHYKVERRGEGDRGIWWTVEEFSSEEPFWLEGATGRCKVLPAGAEVIPAQTRTWLGDSQDDTRNPVDESHSTGRYRFTERFLWRGQPVYATGGFRSVNVIASQDNRTGREDTLGKSDREFLLSGIPQSATADLLQRRAQDWLTWFVVGGALAGGVLWARFAT